MSSSLDITIGFCAPSRALPTVTDTDAIWARLTGQGAHVIFEDSVFKNVKQFAGTDEERLTGFMNMVRDYDIDVVMPIRGGYGATRLLDDIDFDEVASHAPILCGYSDFTAINLAYLALTGEASWQGPSGSDFINEPPAMTWESFKNALFDPVWRVAFASDFAQSGETEGILWGGNLSIVTTLLGTDYFPEIEGGILFLEDTNERAYRIERMLVQLYQAGVLERQNAILLGDFKNADPKDPDDNDYLFADVVAFLRELVPHVPVITGLPFGHTPVKLMMPVGAQVLLSARAGRIELTSTDHPGLYLEDEA